MGGLTSLGRNDSRERFKLINWFGIVTGIFMIVLPFLGAWWRAEVGAGAIELAISPFYYQINVIGQTLTSPLISYLIIGAQLAVIIGGVFMIIGSLKVDKWWGEKLMRFGAMKVFWLLIILLIILLIGALIMNNFLPNAIAGSIEGEANINLNIPYIIGSATTTIEAPGISIMAPIENSLTPVFGLAALTAVLGILARIYHNKLMDKLCIESD